MAEHKIRNLNPEEIECRVGTVMEQGITLLLYKNARVDQTILDEVFGICGWQRRHNMIGSELYCILSIWDDDCKVKELEKQKTGLANQIKAAMGGYETGEVDGTVVSWKKISRESLDSKRLRKEQPEVFAEYRNISSYRKLSIA